MAECHPAKPVLKRAESLFLAICTVAILSLLAAQDVRGEETDVLGAPRQLLARESWTGLDIPDSGSGTGTGHWPTIIHIKSQKSYREIRVLGTGRGRIFEVEVGKTHCFDAEVVYYPGHRTLLNPQGVKWEVLKGAKGVPEWCVDVKNVGEEFELKARILRKVPPNNPFGWSPTEEWIDDYVKVRGVFPEIIEFGPGTHMGKYWVKEGGNVEIVITRNGTGTGDVSVQWEVVTGLGSATVGQDYVHPSDDKVYWPDKSQGDERKYITVLDDYEAEGNESLFLRLHSPTGKRVKLGRSQVEVVIEDDDDYDVLEFDKDSYSIAEDGGEAKIKVVRKGAGKGNISVDFETIDGSATAPQDYTSVSKTLTWKHGDMDSKDVPIPIRDDKEGEPQEQLRLVLKNPRGEAKPPSTLPYVKNAKGSVRLGSPKEATLTIEDNDAQMAVFDPTMYRVDEGVGTVTVWVKRVGGKEGELTVDCYTQDATAEAGKDYKAKRESLTWTHGDAGPKPFIVEIIDDDEGERREETIHVQLENPRNKDGVKVAMDARVEATIVIEDNEEERITIDTTSTTTTPPPARLNASLDCGESFELAPGDFAGRGCGIVIRGWRGNTEDRVTVQANFPRNVGLEVFPGDWSKSPSNMFTAGRTDFHDRYVLSQSFRASRDARPGTYPVTFTVQQQGAGPAVTLRLQVMILQPGRTPSQGPGIRPPATVTTGRGGQYCVWRYKMYGDPPPCFHFAAAPCNAPRYRQPSYELIGQDMTWGEADALVSRMSRYQEDAYNCLDEPQIHTDTRQDGTSPGGPPQTTPPSDGTSRHGPPTEEDGTLGGGAVSGVGDPRAGQEGDRFMGASGATYELVNGEWVEVSPPPDDRDQEDAPPFDDEWRTAQGLLESRGDDRQRDQEQQWWSEQDDAGVRPFDMGGLTTRLDRDKDEEPEDTGDESDAGGDDTGDEPGGEEEGSPTGGSQPPPQTTTFKCKTNSDCWSKYGSNQYYCNKKNGKCVKCPPGQHGRKDGAAACCKDSSKGSTTTIRRSSTTTRATTTRPSTTTRRTTTVRPSEKPTKVTFPDSSGRYKIQVHFPQGDGKKCRKAKKKRGSRSYEYIEILLPGVPKGQHHRAEKVSVKVSGKGIKSVYVYSNYPPWDSSNRRKLKKQFNVQTGEYYAVRVYPHDGPYSTTVFAIRGAK